MKLTNEEVMINAGLINLEMRSRAMHALLHIGLVSAAGPSGDRNGVWEAIVSTLHWDTIRPFLDSQSVPYKIGISADAGQVAFNGADW